MADLTRTPQEAKEKVSDEELAKEFAAVINRHSLETVSQTPDFIIAEYLVRCLHNFEQSVVDREKWYGRSDSGSRL